MAKRRDLRMASLCASKTSGSQSATVTYTVSRPGSSTSAGAVTIKSQIENLADGYSDHGIGFFGAFISFTESGSITK